MRDNCHAAKLSYKLVCRKKNMGFHMRMLSFHSDSQSNVIAIGMLFAALSVWVG